MFKKTYLSHILHFSSTSLSCLSVMCSPKAMVAASSIIISIFQQVCVSRNHSSNKNWNRFIKRCYYTTCVTSWLNYQIATIWFRETVVTSFGGTLYFVHFQTFFMLKQQHHTLKKVEHAKKA